MQPADSLDVNPSKLQNKDDSSLPQPPDKTVVRKHGSMEDPDPDFFPIIEETELDKSKATLNAESPSKLP